MTCIEAMNDKHKSTMPSRVLINQWKEFIKWYIKRSRNWSILTKHTADLNNEVEKLRFLDKAYGLWGDIWHEHDLVLVFAHRLLNYIEEQGLKLHLHVSYRLKPTNFRFIEEFYDRLSKAVNILRKKLRLTSKWVPEIDLIITSDKPPFEYCFEFKYYHYIPVKINPLWDLRRKILVLDILKKYHVCKNTVLIILDDAICRKDLVLCNKIKNLLNNESKNLIVLSYYVGYDELRIELEKHNNSS